MRLFALCLLTTALLACSDDDSFSPTMGEGDQNAKRYEQFKDRPCDDSREGREVVVEKKHYTCVYDDFLSEYFWVSENDTLTADGWPIDLPSSSSYSSDSFSSSSSRLSSSSSSRYSSGSSSSSNTTTISPNSSASSSSMSSSRASSSSVTSSSSTFPTSRDELLNPTIGYGVIIDSRDKKRYRTIKVAGRTWMAENLNYADSTLNPILKGQSFCYGNDNNNCEVLGRLYSRAAAMNSATCAFGQSCNLGKGVIKGICPDGWHMPTVAEGNELVNFVGASNASAARSAKGWNAGITQGKNTNGLSFAGSGNRSDQFKGKGENSFTWLYMDHQWQYYILLQGSKDNIAVTNYSTNELFLPIRCVMDTVASSSSIARSSSSYSSSRSSSSRYSSSSRTSSTSTLMAGAPILKQKGEQFNSSINYGTMTDPRDGKTYRTINYGGYTWMAENLNYAGHSEGNSLCINNDTTYCDLYGRLYDGEAAINSSACYANKEECGPDPLTFQGVCPDGWHLLTYSETSELMYNISNVAATIMSKKGWASDTASITPGTDTYGFSFVGSGNYSKKGFCNFGEIHFSWIYYQHGYLIGFSVNAKENTAFHNSASSDNKDLYEAVRCVKDH